MGSTNSSLYMKQILIKGDTAILVLFKCSCPVVVEKDLQK